MKINVNTGKILFLRVLTEKYENVGAANSQGVIYAVNKTRFRNKFDGRYVSWQKTFPRRKN